MFGIGIRYLNGWAMAAADGANKMRAEWPPHPDRVFMALAAAWFETGQEQAEGEALRWLESLENLPGIAAPEAETREIVTCYVPVNDSELAGETKCQKTLRKAAPSVKELKETGLAVAVEFRPRQERSFPVAIPHGIQFEEIPCVYLVWPNVVPEQYRDPLAAVCRKVISVGHPASLVQMWLADSPPIPTLVAQNGITRHRLRVFRPGKLDYLADKCGRNKHIAFVDNLWAKEQNSSKPQEISKLQRERKNYLYGIVESLRPDQTEWVGYDTPVREPVAKAAGSIFDPRLLVFVLSGKKVPLTATLRLTEALRGTLIAGTPQPVPEWLSGHAPDGSCSKKPHIAFLPLPFIGREHADGHLMGMGIALPRDLEPIEAGRVLEPWLRDAHGVPKSHILFNGKWFECQIRLKSHETPAVSLCSEIWTRRAATWGSVTPVVLDRHFDGKDKWERAVESVKDACVRIGLPRPSKVLLHPVSIFEGVPRSNEFPRLIRKKDGGRMHHTHAVVIFNEEIEGPVIIGAGRFRGYGVCRPLSQEGGNNA